MFVKDRCRMCRPPLKPSANPLYDMKSQSQQLTAQESLDIISAMIRQAKGNVRRNNFYFLLWGWVVVLAQVGMYVLDRMEVRHPYAVWLITLPAWAYTLYMVSQQKKMERATTHFDRITGWLWISFGVTICFLVFFGYRINYQLNPVILIISAIPTVVSGVILNFRPLIAGGIFFWVSGIVSFLVAWETQPLIGAVAIAGGYLVPGYMLRNRKGDNV